MTKEWATRGTLGLGHVSSYYSPITDTCQHPIRQSSTNDWVPHRHLPCHRMVRPCHITIWTIRTGTVSIQNFPCLAWRTNRDIFSIRTPFEKVNIPPESRRRDGRNGTIFIAFWVLLKLSKIWSPGPDFDHPDGRTQVIVCQHMRGNLHQMVRVWEESST